MFSKKVKKAADKYGKENGYEVKLNKHTIDLKKDGQMLELEEGKNEGRVNDYNNNSRFGKTQWYMEDDQMQID